MEVAFLQTSLSPSKNNIIRAPQDSFKQIKYSLYDNNYPEFFILSHILLYFDH